MQLSISLVRALTSAVEREGATRADYFALAGIDPALVERDDARLDLKTYIRALEAAIAATQNPALGLQLGQHATSAMYHVVAHLAEVAKTLGDAIDTILRYSGILASGFEPCLVEQREQGLVALRLPYLIGEHSAVRLTAEHLRQSHGTILAQAQWHGRCRPTCCRSRKRISAPSPRDHSAV